MLDGVAGDDHDGQKAAAPCGLGFSRDTLPCRHDVGSGGLSIMAAVIGGLRDIGEGSGSKKRC